MTAHEYRDESGAVLILALIFMVVTAMIVTGLTAWSSNDIQNVGNLKTGRSALYASDGATQDAVWAVRYVYTPAATGFCPNTPWNSPFSIDNESIYVICTSGTPNEASTASRVVVLSAYPASQCSASGCSPTFHPYLQARVTFNDFSSLNKNDCSATGLQTTCGSGETVNSWVLQPGLK